ncbi:MAG TPA: long-chain fatty acid--CoA ligase [Treponema sp.]|nr:long-chain fatty acid--CoA ligase [Treponema sp.]
MLTIEDIGSYTFPAMLAHTLEKFSDRPALSFITDEPINYAEVGEKIATLREALYCSGVEQGDRVILLGPSSPEWGIAYFAITTIGAIAVPLLPDFTAKEVESCIRHSEATTLIIATRLADRVPNPGELSIERVFRLDDLDMLVGSLDRPGPVPIIAISEEDTASIIYTSGTTGRSKGVELTHKNLVFCAIRSQFFQRINKIDVGLSILPMSHVYEFTIGFLMFFMNGACLYYLQRAPTVSTLLPALKQIRPTIMLSVPLIMEKIYKNKIVPTFTTKPLVAKLYRISFFRKIFHRIAGRSLKKTFGGRIKFFGIGGAKVDPIVERFMKEAKFPYAIGYGLTETSPLLAGSGPKVTRPGTIGAIMPGVEMQIRDQDPKTGIGEVVVRGENVMKGYYRDPEMTAQVIDEDGWFNTGDIGSLDKKNRLSLKGRSKNLILGSGGENIYPEDIEFVLNQHPLVSESLVVEGENASLVALVQINEEKVAEETRKREERMAANPVQGLTEAMGDAVNDAVSEVSHMFAYKREEILAEIKFFVNENVNRTSRVTRVEPVEEFEKTASQKIKRYLYTIKKSIQSVGK